MIDLNYGQFGRSAGKSLHYAEVVKMQQEKEKQLVQSFDSRPRLAIWDESHLALQRSNRKEVGS